MELFHSKSDNSHPFLSFSSYSFTPIHYALNWRLRPPPPQRSHGPRNNNSSSGDAKGKRKEREIPDVLPLLLLEEE